MKRKILNRFIFSAFAFCLSLGLTPSAGATDPAQPLTTLKLVRTYPSEDALRAAHPELFPEQPPLDNSVFASIEQGPTLEELTFTAEEKARLADPNNVEPIQKTFYAYSTLRNEFLMVSEYELEIYNTFELQAFDMKTAIKQLLYNKHGQLVTDLPNDINDIQISPDKQYFVAYYDGETESKNFYFYHSNGTLLRQYELYGYPQVKYSANGNYVELFNLFGNDFYIFTKQGELCFKGDIRDYEPHLNNLFISDDGNHILLNTSRLAILIDSSGRVLWKEPSSYIHNVHFVPLKESLIMICSNPEKNRIGEEAPYILKIVSSKTGKLLDERISDISEVYIMNNTIVIKKGETYNEYTIK